MVLDYRPGAKKILSRPVCGETDSYETTSEDSGAPDFLNRETLDD